MECYDFYTLGKIGTVWCYEMDVRWWRRRRWCAFAIYSLQNSIRRHRTVTFACEFSHTFGFRLANFSWWESEHVEFFFIKWTSVYSLSICINWCLCHLFVFCFVVFLYEWISYVCNNKNLLGMLYAWRECIEYGEYRLRLVLYHLILSLFKLGNRVDRKILVWAAFFGILLRIYLMLHFWSM